MVRGSKLRKCHICGKKLFWIIPVKNYGLFMDCERKIINDHRHDGKGYVCLDCWKGEAK